MNLTDTERAQLLSGGSSGMVWAGHAARKGFLDTVESRESKLRTLG
jgi:hypothetical protein